MATSSDIKGFFAVAINQNRQMLIDNLNNLGYSIPNNISNQNLVDTMFTIYSQKGADEIGRILTGIPIDTSKNSIEELSAIRETLTGKASAQGTRNFFDDLQKLWAGTSSTTGANTSTTKEPAVSPFMAGLVVIVLSVIIGVAIFKS